jgi:NADP-dependent 3-hydroxy acid dehydrogenase YdfG
MKIAITGHTAGIGQALAQEYISLGHTIVGLSKREGNNIRNIPKICDQIESCDMFINNAQAGFAQTELLFELWRRWSGQDKTIIVISTQMTQDPTAFFPELDEYRVQKVALEEACCQLRQRAPMPYITIVRPGNVATSPDKTVPPAADVGRWSKFLVNTLESARPDLFIPEISLGPQ